MIHPIVGKLGAGKGVLIMRHFENEVVSGYRDIVTDLPIKLQPWVNGNGLAQLGLLEYFSHKYDGETFDIEHRLKLIDPGDDLEEHQLMFLWRRDGETGEWFKLELSEDGTTFDPTPIKTRHCRPCLVINDEAWATLGNTLPKEKFPKCIQFYGRQQRKLFDEWYVATQHHDDLNVVFERVSQDWLVCRNHAMEKLGIFRQGKWFSVREYTTQPRKGAKCQKETYHRPDVKGLLQCYDTSAGIGFAGGFAADTTRKSVGLSPLWLVAGIILLVCGLIAVPHVFGKAASAWIGNVTSGSNPSKWSGSATPTNNLSRPVPRPEGDGGAPVGTGQSTNRSSVSRDPVYMTGIALAGAKVRVFLSDGRTYFYGDGYCTALDAHSCTIDGQRYALR